MKCWRHDYSHREYICRCDPPIEDDTGYDDATPELDNLPLDERIRNGV